MSSSWLQKLIRKKTRPIPYKKANRWRDRMSVAYALITWNALGYVGKVITFECSQLRLVNHFINISIRLLLLSTGYLYYKGRLNKEYYGQEPDEIDMLTPAQRFALQSNMQNVKIISSSDFKVQDFNLEDYKHLQPKQTDGKQKIDEHDEDNVA